MNQTATATKSHRKAAPTIVAKLDLSDENARRLHGLIQRLHAGRWPLFKCLGMRQVNGVLYEAVEWLRMAKPSFGVVTWRADGSGMCWQDAQTAQDARAMLTAKASLQNLKTSP